MWGIKVVGTQHSTGKTSLIASFFDSPWKETIGSLYRLGDILFEAKVGTQTYGCRLTDSFNELQGDRWYEYNIIVTFDITNRDSFVGF